MNRWLAQIHLVAPRAGEVHLTVYPVGSNTIYYKYVGIFGKVEWLSLTRANHRSILPISSGINILIKSTYLWGVKVV